MVMVPGSRMEGWWREGGESEGGRGWTGELEECSTVFEQIIKRKGDSGLQLSCTYFGFAHQL